jgi:hypothetical protein
MVWRPISTGPTQANAKNSLHLHLPIQLHGFEAETVLRGIFKKLNFPKEESDSMLGLAGSPL